MIRSLTCQAIIGASFCLLGIGAEAQYVEDTVIPALEDEGAVVKFDGPIAAGAGQRWENVAILVPTGEREFRFDWVEEIPDGDGVRITVSPTGSMFYTSEGDPVRIGEIRQEDFVWFAAGKADDFSHRVSLTSLAIDGEVPEDDEEISIRVNGLDANLSFARNSDLTIRAGGTLAGLVFEVAGVDGADGKVSVSFSDLSGRHETDIPTELLDRADDEDMPPREELDRMFRPYSASAMALGELKIEGDFVDEENGPLTGNVTLSDVTGSYALDGREDATLAGDVRFGGISGSANMMQGSGDIELGALTFNVAADILREDLYDFIEEANTTDEPSIENIAALNLLYRATSEGGAISADVNADGVNGALSFSSDGGFEEIRLQDGVVTIDSETNRLALSGIASHLGPEELSVDLEKAGFGFVIPVIPRPDGPADPFRFRFLLQDLLMSDSVWTMFDPGGDIPREALTIDVDLSALGRVTELLSGDPPPDAIIFERATLEKLLIRGGGAEITGEGSADVNMAQMPFTGDGSFTFTIKGIMTLSGALAQTGMVPPTALIGMRGALGAFAKPVGEDHYVSRIDINPDGSITANGLDLPLPQ